MKRISVIIPCYNYGRFLGESIESALAQASPGLDVEVIVIDDGSTDETRAVAAPFGDRIHYLFQENQGLSAARNTGLAAARHDLVTFLDSDDCFMPGSLAHLVELWESMDPKPGILASRHLEVDETSENLIYPPPVTDGKISKVTAKQLVFCNRFCPTILASRSHLTKIGGFDSDLTASEDRDMWIRAATKWEVILVNKVSIKKRNHGTNLSRSAENQTATIERVLRKSFSNNEINLSWFEKKYAWAVCHYQSALMYADAGEHRVALARMARSLIAYPFGRGDPGAIPPFARMRGLASLARKVLFERS